MVMTGRERPAGAAALAIAAVLVWGGCSVEKHYKVLSFFFDGVPEPSSVGVGDRAGDDGARSRTVPAVLVSWHRAYVERRCSVCHGDKTSFGFTTTGFTDLDSSACIRCHDDAMDEAFLHGPVAAGACTACHEPHESRYPRLLVAVSPSLCLQCHASELELEPITPGHEDPAQDCLECHLAHGGDDRYFLRRAPP